MAKLPFDFKGFSKIASDDTHTTMRNKQNHQIKIAHSALSKDMREQLNALPMSKQEAKDDKKQSVKLADGGEVRESAAQQVSKGASESQGQYDERKQEADRAKSQPNYGNKITPAWQGMADGGDVRPAEEVAKVTDDANNAPPAAPITINIAHPSIPDNYTNPYAGQQARDQAQLQGNPVQDNTPPLQDVYGVSKEQQAQMMQANAPAPAMQAPAGLAPAGVAPALPSAADASQAPGANPDPYGMEAYQNSLGQGIAEQKAGIMGEAQAMSQQGAGQARALSQAIGQQQGQMKSYQDHYNELDTERKNFQHDLENQHIDPKHYLNNMSTTQKIGTGIGLILGGMGSGVTGGENPAMAFLNKQIDRDIDSQKAELGKKENLLSANLKQFGNLRDAMDMTHVMQNDIIMNKLKLAAAQAANPLAQANALKAIGQIDTENASRLQQLAVRKTMMGALSQAGSDPNQMGQVIQAMRQMSPEMAKSMEERFIPGVGMAQIPVPQVARETIIAKQTLQQQAQDFYQWAQKHSGSLDPATVNEGKTKAAELQSLYRNAINGGVFKKGEQEFIDNIVDSDPTKFFNSIRVLPKLQEVMRSNMRQLGVLKQGYGIQTQQIHESAPVIPGRR